MRAGTPLSLRRSWPIVPLVLVGIVVLPTLQDESSIRPDEVRAFSEGLAPIVQSWGSVEILGMRPAVADLRDAGGVPAGAIVTEAQAWQEAFAQNRRDLAALGIPAGLEDVVRMLEASLDHYIAAAKAFEAAAARVEDGASPDLDAGIDEAAAGAELFDRAAALLQELRRSPGLAPDPSLPTGNDETGS